MSLKHTLRCVICIGALVLANPLEPRASSDTTRSDIQLRPASDHRLPSFNASSSSNKSTISLKSSGDTDTRLYPTSNSLPFAYNSTAASDTPLNVTSDNREHIKCNGASYGFNLDILDCEQAKADIRASPDENQWAERHTGWLKQIWPLPFRTMGDKASCYVQTVLIGDATSAKASLNQVRNAAASIRNYCASRGKLQGGIATNIGGDNNLAVIMGGYQPASQIKCGSTTSLPTDPCEEILEDMPATTKKEVFGHSGDPATQVSLPYYVQSQDTSCKLQIYSTSVVSDTTTWYELYEAATAMWSACLRQSRSGGLSGLGKFLVIPDK